MASAGLGQHLNQTLAFVEVGFSVGFIMDGQLKFAFMDYDNFCSMYVKVNRNDISQIDIKIYDGAGVLVPFHQDAVTNIRLHFRKI